MQRFVILLLAFDGIKIYFQCVFVRQTERERDRERGMKIIHKYYSTCWYHKPNTKKRTERLTSYRHLLMMSTTKLQMKHFANKCIPVMSLCLSCLYEKCMLIMLHSHGIRQMADNKSVVFAYNRMLCSPLNVTFRMTSAMRSWLFWFNYTRSWMTRAWKPTEMWLEKLIYGRKSVFKCMLCSCRTGWTHISLFCCHCRLLLRQRSTAFPSSETWQNRKCTKDALKFTGTVHDFWTYRKLFLRKMIQLMTLHSRGKFANLLYSSILTQTKAPQVNLTDDVSHFQPVTAY